MKHLSLQWRITLLTALLIACACVCMNLLLYRTGVTGMDALNGFMMQYQPGSADPLTIEIPQEEMSSLLAHFSQEVYDAKVVFGRKGWCITVVVTIVSAAIAYFVSGRALKPLQQLAQQAQQVDQDSIATTRLDENTVQEFGQLSRSVNRMLDGLAQSFELQRQFAGNAAHELRTPLAILQTKLELFAEEHPAMDAETAGLIRSLREQLDRLTALVRTLLEMSNLQSVSRTDQIALAPLVEEILTDLTPLAQKNNISLQQDCEELGMVGSDALIYRLVFNLVENGIKYNRPGGAVRVTLQQEKQTAVLRVADTGPGIPADCRESIFQPFFRVDKSRSREMGGVGLGLALVREIAVLHGGSVTVERSSENGTTFAVTLRWHSPAETGRGLLFFGTRGEYTGSRRPRKIRRTKEILKMQATIHNEFLTLTVDTHGAEAVSLKNAAGEELLWQADPAVWKRHAPILFPWTGKLPGGTFEVDGKTYKGGQHGFARDMEHTLLKAEGDTIQLELRSDDAIKAERFPFDFVLTSTFRLDGKTVHHTLTVRNPGTEELRFGIGYHPAFNIPFDAQHTTTDYEFRFDQPESPVILDARPNGLLSGKCYYQWKTSRPSS